MGKRNGRWHQLRRFVAGKAEHQPLIACALFCRAFPLRGDAIDSLLNIAGLFAHFADHPAGVGVKNAVAVDISDVANARAHALLEIKLRIAGYLPGDHHEIALGKGLASHATQRVLFETSVEDVIADGVANLIRMSFGDGLGGKNVAARHGLKSVKALKG